jgi:hypothetical protein
LKSTADSITAFVDVSVVAMDVERVLPHQTVIVRADRITNIGLSSGTQIPRGAVRINGRGMFLMPGLADMHAHPETLLDLVTYLASGVTTVRAMGSPPDLRIWRAEAAAGRLLIPAIYTAGPVLDGPSEFFSPGAITVTASNAVQTVREQHAAGFDFIKVYNGLSSEAYGAIIMEARRLGMPVGGHVPIQVGLQGALAARQASVEHLRGYSLELIRADAPVEPSEDLRSRTLAWNYADESRFADLAEATRRSGVWNCPTLVWSRTQLLPREAYAQWLARPELRYAPPDWRVDSRSRLPYFKNFTDADYLGAQQGIPIQQRFVKSLRAAGAHLLLGTDLGAFAVAEEISLLSGAGLSPYEVLRTGTHDAAEFLGQLNDWGTIAEGRRADLVLLDANPLVDATKATHPVGVMLRGRWLPKTAIETLVAETANAKPRKPL